MAFSDYATHFSSLLHAADETEIDHLLKVIYEAYQRGAMVFLIGNGGSGANASHICEDLGKGTLVDFENQRRLRVLSLTDNSPYILAWGNDTSYDRVFVEQLKNLAMPGDVLIAISGSGNSPNVLRAVEYANQNGMHTFAVTGYDGGKLLGMAQESLWVKSFDMGMVEGMHSVIFHYMTDQLRQKFQENSRQHE